ncbi:acetylcholinesterase-1-like [Centruroides sculpturatus]|uniref:acetylcholinesterase-1-like n=1 Tax=Centruroides sculpturatus TaxID=218467 RepID=UPI000C6CC9AF|nr:acetylcholinesterase-1-like [Centruroides sculpturatus]
MKIFHFIAIIISLFNCYEQNSLIVNTTSGIFKGKTMNIQNVNVREYLGIPYALPPVKELRFKNPRPAPYCCHIREAIHKPPSCLQILTDFTVKSTELLPMSEDCLYLNVWVPERERQQQPLSTMVWIYPGSFVIGSASDELSDGEVIAAVGNVIVISIAYRLGPFGFFHFDEEEAPGNMGMMDQVLAVKWVHNNIKEFGGDPNKVILFGQSSGGISIANHLVSPLMEGLYQRVIIQSLSKLSDNQIFTSINISNNRDISKIIATNVGCANDNSKEAVACMRQLESSDIVLAMEDYMNSIPIGISLLPEINSPYLPDNIVKIHNVDIMIGNVVDEESIFLELYHPKFLEEENPKLNKFEAERDIKMYFNKTDERTDFRVIFNEYLGNVSDTDYTTIVNRTYKAMGDGLRLCPSYFMAETLTKNRNLYHYMFNHKRRKCGRPKWTGVAHSEELYFLFGMPFKNPECYTLEEQDFSVKIIQMWTSFAKYGIPFYPGMDTPFLPFGTEKNSIEIRLEDMQTRKDPLRNICKVWRNFYRYRQFFVEGKDPH